MRAQPALCRCRRGLDVVLQRRSTVIEHDQGVQMDRRRVLQALAVAPVAWRLGEPVDLRTKAAELFANTNDPPAQRHEQARGLLVRVMRERDSSLVPLAVDTACLAALTGYTSGQRNAGFTYTGVAQSLAEDAGQPELIARAAGMRRLYFSAEVGIGAPRQAAAWGQRAVDNAEPGVMRAWALANLAPELAAGKQRKACFQALTEADRQWGRGSGYGLFSTDGYLGCYRSPAPVIGMTGRSLALLGDGKGALTELGAALSVPGPPTIVWYIDSMLAYVADGACDLACDTAMTALEACKETGYGLGIQRVRSIRARFPPSWQTTAGVQALNDYLALC